LLSIGDETKRRLRHLAFEKMRHQEPIRFVIINNENHKGRRATLLMTMPPDCQHSELEGNTIRTKRFRSQKESVGWWYLTFSPQPQTRARLTTEAQRHRRRNEHKESRKARNLSPAFLPSWFP